MTKRTPAKPSRRTRHPARETSANKTAPFGPKKQAGQFGIHNLIFVGVILAATFLAYTPTLENGMLNWDDNVYVVDNPVIRNFTSANLELMWTSTFAANYHPLTMMSIAFDYRNHKLDPRGYHLTNLIIHVVNTALVYWFVYVLVWQFNRQRPPNPRKGWESEIALVSSLLFGLHTLHVESVAWIAQRKDLLYTMFFLLSLIAYLRFVRTRGFLIYALALLLFVCSLLSKAMAVSLTVTLLAIDFGLERKWLSRDVLLEKAPFLLLSLAFGSKAIVAQSATGALAWDPVFSFYERIAFAGFGFTQYLVRLFAPVGSLLSAFYAYPKKVNDSIPDSYWIYPLVFVLVVPVFVFAVRRSRLSAFAILFFLINIFLVLQLLPVGSAIMADRYTYLPSIGFFLLAGIGYAYLSRRWGKVKFVLPVLLLGYSGFLFFETYMRTQVWRGNLVFWGDVLKKDQSIPSAWNNRGIERHSMGDFRGAIEDYNHAIKSRPGYHEAFNNRGIAKGNLGDRRGAIEDFDRAVRIKPDYEDAYSNRGNAKRQAGDPHGAIEDQDKAIALKKNFAKAYLNRGVAKIDIRDYEGAIEDLDIAVSILPDLAEAHYNMGNVYFGMQRYEEAIESYDEALRLRPNYVEAYGNKAASRFRLKDYKGAIEEYDRAVRYKPDFVRAYADRGVAKLEIGDFSGANEDLNKAIDLSPKDGRSYYIRGLVKEEMNHKKAACEDFMLSARLGTTLAISRIEESCKD